MKLANQKLDKSINMLIKSQKKADLNYFKYEIIK